jgi:hypothetical protein
MSVTHKNEFWWIEVFLLSIEKAIAAGVCGVGYSRKIAHTGFARDCYFAGM